jgi:amino acid adenylation domain-containing protein
VAADRLAHHLRAHPELPLHDVAHTLQEGRQVFSHRLAVVAATSAQAADALLDRSSQRTIIGSGADSEVPVAFMFPGQGSQYAGMARELYRTEPVYRGEFDSVANAVRDRTGHDIRSHEEQATRDPSSFALLATELAMARLLMAWGVKPAAMIGHGIGELAAACLAGVMTREDAVSILACVDGALSKSGPSVLLVRKAARELRPMLDSSLSIDAENAPDLSVISGPEAAVDALEQLLRGDGVWCRRNARRSASVPLAPDVACDLPEVLARIRFAQPDIRWVSGLTGEWITPDEIQSAAYWTQLLRGTIKFSAGVKRLLQAEGLQLLEVGPGGVLNTLVRRQSGQASQRIGTTIGNVAGRDVRSMLEVVSRLWVKGVTIDWPALRSNEARRHVPLPTYPFERKRHWIDPPKFDASPAIELAPMSPVEKPLSRDSDDVRTRAFALVSASSGIPRGEISGSASFLELGLDSLLLTQLVGAISRQFGVEITLPQLLSEYATPDKLARRLAEITSAAVRSEIDVPAKPLIVSRPRDRDIPLSSAQRRLWFMDRLEGPNATYVIPLAVRMRGTLDRVALEQTLGDVVLRHESLRTIYPDDGGTPKQKILAGFSPPLTRSTVALEALSAAMAAECRRGFNLESEPPFRAHLFELGGGDHVVLLQVHHIAGDGFSLMALAKDVSAAYAARVQGSAPQFPPLAVQYADFAAYQAEMLGAAEEPGSLMSRQLAFWTETLKGLPVEITLPKDRPRPAVASYRGDRLAVNIDASLHKRLVETAAAMEGSVFMVLQAALATLLTRLGGGTDIPIGSPIAGRTDNSLTDLVGCFVNMLVLRTDTSGNPTFRDLVARVRTSNLGAYAHQELPFERLVEGINPERSLARHPLFQVMLALLNTSRIDFKMPGMETALEPVNTGTAQYDLSFYFNERRGIDGAASGIEGVLEFSTDLFDRQTAERMVNAFLLVLLEATANPDTAIFDLPVLAPEERKTLLETWNSTAAPIPAGGIHTMFERQAERTPDRTAVIAGAARLTYAELNLRANQIAHALRARGVERGGRVGVCLDRSADLPATLLGILKAGACYVPLDPAFPEERLIFMAENAELTAAVCTSALSDLVNLPRDQMLLLDADAALIAQASCEPIPADHRAAEERDPAYILYTSGSTGKPKGVVVPHRAVVNFLASMAHEPGLSPEDTLLAVTTLSFDIAVLELYLPLTVGAAVVIASRDQASDGEALGNLIETSGATVMQATPASWRMLLAAGWRNPRPFKALIGGEALPKDLADELIVRGVALWNMYGPTETTVWSTCALIRDTTAGITIGKPIANTHIHILDEHGGLCPIGVPGELCISGAGVSLGYWKRPELTAERFVTDPYGADGGTLYRTGDRARWRPDGTLEHMGRLDDQVKVRGFRIELGEIEAVLAFHPQVRQSAVRLLQAGPDDVRILAYYVPENAGLVATSGLRKHMRNYLPDYMIPQMFLTIDEIPLTPNGKVDRRRLPEPVTAGSRTNISEPLSDPFQIAIAKIWTDLIGPSRPLGASDRFFEMGGHSLLALQALRRMETATGVKLDLRTLFQESLEEIAARCRMAGTAPVVAASPAAPASKPLFGFLRRLKESGREPRV